MCQVDLAGLWDLLTPEREREREREICLGQSDNLTEVWFMGLCVRFFYNMGWGCDIRHLCKQNLMTYVNVVDLGIVCAHQTWDFHFQSGRWRCWRWWWWYYMVVQTSIFTDYPTRKVHVGEISYKLSCGPVAEGFRRRTLASKFGTSPKSQHEDLRCSKDFRWNEGMQRRQELNFRRSDRYNGPSLFTELKAGRSCLYWILCSTGNQWRVCRTGAMWSDLGIPKMSLAESFWTFWSLWMSCLGQTAIRELQ